MEIDPQIIEAGSVVKAHQATVDDATTALDNNKSMIADIYSRKANASMELEMLNAREDLTLEMKYRKVELEGAIETSKNNIENLSRDTANHEHRISIASAGLNSAKMNYQKLVQPSIGQLSSYDIDFLKKQKPRSQQSFAEKKQLSDRFGHEACQTHIPLV